jgi:predicted Fe-Mo cluster-binding NifX family protein
MKVCIPNSDLKVSRNFGKAQKFAIAVIEDGHIVSSEVVPNPGREKVKIPVYLAALGITHVIADGIGNPAIAIFNGEDIEVYSGAAGPIEGVLGQFLRGELENKRKSCAGENICGAQYPK